jgi:UDP-N-acetylglucosamine diphosphorylase / glucose-1-phosphate thymidylyltransferase / UDP-N-acetylgalactosamine diphosphorylase / glucosamine-1-phosphate N-acetyltransferase / galactosamine-1-phosphate N-acetyltransferase
MFLPKIDDIFDLDTIYFSDLFSSSKKIWEHTDNISPYLKNFFKNRKQSNLIFSRIDEKAVLADKNIYIGKNCLIEPGVVIKGPAYIDSGTVLRSGAYIRGGVLAGKNCIIGHSTEIKNSILLNYAKAPHFNYIGNSILGNFVNLGAGVKIANLRLDEKNIKIKIKAKVFKTNMRKLGAIIGDRTNIGCNSVLNPGTVLGKNCIVYPLKTVSGVNPGFSIIK